MYTNECKVGKLMQLKLLNFYKMLANIANNLVGAFVPLIVYKATGSLVDVALFLFVRVIFRLISDITLKNFIQSKPEIFLIIRFFTVAIYCFSLTIISSNIILGCLLVALFYGLDNSIKTLANETLFNYASSARADSSNIGLTRLFEELGVLLGVFVGGLLLDVDQLVVYILATIMYFVSILPLFVYYIKNKKNPAFNKELVSNATTKLTENNTIDNKKSVKYIILSMLMCYGVVYFCFAPNDTISMIFNVNNFLSGGTSYSFASYIIITFEITYAVGGLLVSRLDRRHDLLDVARGACLILAGVFVVMTFVHNTIVMFVCFGLFGFVQPVLSIFVLQRLMQKSRILGASNSAFVMRDIACCVSYAVLYLLVLVFGLLNISLSWYFLVAGIMMIVTFFVMPYMEEKTRKMLVDFVEDNDISTNNTHIL